MAATPKPIRKEAKKVELGQKKVSKAGSYSKEYERHSHKIKPAISSGKGLSRKGKRKDFAKYVATARMSKKK